MCYCLKIMVIDIFPCLAKTEMLSFVLHCFRKIFQSLHDGFEILPFIPVLDHLSVSQQCLKGQTEACVYDLFDFLLLFFFCNK